MRNTRIRGDAVAPIEGISVAGSDFDPGGTESNLLLWSEDFSNAAWDSLAALNNNTVATDTVVAPDSNTTADVHTLLNTSSALTGLIGETTTDQLTATVYIKTGVGLDWVRFTLLKTTSTFIQARMWFNMATGATGQSGGNGGAVLDASDATDVGGGWFRLRVTGSSTSGFDSVLISHATADGSTSRSAGATVTVWGAQCTKSAAAVTYRKTTNTRYL